MQSLRRTRLFAAAIAMIGIAALAGCSWGSDPADEADTTAPTINSTVPIDTTPDVGLNATINATFSEAMDVSTMVAANVSLMTGGLAVEGDVLYDDATNTVSFVTAANLSPSTAYMVTISAGAKDLAGNALNATSWTFTTGTSVDNSAPTVVSVVPSNNGTDIAVDALVYATFSEGMDISTINTINFTLAAGSTPVAGTVIYNVREKKAIFAPSENLLNDTVFTATVKTGVKDLSGNALAVSKVWTFTTMDAASHLGPDPVRLGTAANFVILAKTAVTTVPASIITGDIGLSPAAESYMTGFSQTKATGYSTAAQVTGYMYAADMTPPTPSYMTTAILDMQAAYTDAAGRSLSSVDDLGAGTIGGLTFAPGLYSWGSNILLTTDITLNGGANDVWIFQSTGNIIVSSGVEVILAGGAQAKNVFWQAAGYAKLGTGAHFEGNILSQTQINLETGATMNGRALAQTQVTLDQNAITKPAQ